VADPVITPPDGSTFSSASCRVTIACATDGASVYYTTNGTTPQTSSKYRYSGPFDIFGTSEIVAIAVKDGLEDSEFVSAVITKVAPPEPLTLAKALDIKGQKVTTGGGADWTAEEDTLAVDKAAARSGVIGCEEETWMSVTVKGPGTLTFKWKGDCEADPRGRYTYDRGVFTVDGTTQTRIDGATDWKSVSVSVTGAGEHVLTWTYVKDDYDEDDYEGGDCIWVDAVTWSGSWPEAGAAFPDLGSSPTAAQVAEAVAGAVDPGVRTHITDGTSYNAFRTWAMAVKDSSGKVAGLDAVANSSWAWLSYALASETLIAALKDGDVKVEGFEPASAAGKFDFTVSVDGVRVGNAASQENLKKVFGIEGGSSLGAMSSDNVALTFGTPANGKVKFTAWPKDTSLSTFFMRVKLVQ